MLGLGLALAIGLGLGQDPTRVRYLGRSQEAFGLGVVVRSGDILRRSVETEAVAVGKREC